MGWHKLCLARSLHTACRNKIFTLGRPRGRVYTSISIYVLVSLRWAPIGKHSVYKPFTIHFKHVPNQAHNIKALAGQNTKIPITIKKHKSTHRKPDPHLTKPKPAKTTHLYSLAKSTMHVHEHTCAAIHSLRITSCTRARLLKPSLQSHTFADIADTLNRNDLDQRRHQQGDLPLHDAR